VLVASPEAKERFPVFLRVCESPFLAPTGDSVQNAQFGPTLDGTASLSPFQSRIQAATTLANPRLEALGAAVHRSGQTPNAPCPMYGHAGDIKPHVARVYETYRGLIQGVYKYSRAPRTWSNR